MFFDPELWPFTRGMRLRIADPAAMGVLSPLVGIGWLARAIVVLENVGHVLPKINAGKILRRELREQFGRPGPAGA